MHPPMLERRGILPKILWYQDDVKVVLRILLIDVKKYFVEVDLHHFRFSTVHDDKVYNVVLHFFGAIVPEKTVNENLGREIRIQFVKAHKFLDWLRLEDNTIQFPQVVPDLDKLEEESFKPLSKTTPGVFGDFEEYRIKNRLNIYPAEFADSSDESDDERCNQLEDSNL